MRRSCAIQTLYRESAALVFLLTLGHVQKSKHDGTHFPEVSTVVRQFAIVAFLPRHYKQKLEDGTKGRDFYVQKINRNFLFLSVVKLQRKCTVVCSQWSMSVQKEHQTIKTGRKWRGDVTVSMSWQKQPTSSVNWELPSYCSIKFAVSEWNMWCEIKV